MREQDEIIRHIERALKWLKQVQADHAAVERLLPHLDQSILATAFCGELVPQDPNDEPASLLLDRLRAAQDRTCEKTRRRRSVRSHARTDAVPMLEAAEPKDQLPCLTSFLLLSPTSHRLFPIVLVSRQQCHFPRTTVGPVR